MTSLRRSLPTIVATPVVVLMLSTVASACPTCKLALESNGGQGDLVSAYMYSILFMMAMPFTLVGSFAAYMYVQVRRARAAEAAMVPVATPVGHE